LKATARKVRCAVYTRVSTDERLDMAFNSLDAQREAALAYIESQKHEGWLLVPDRYDDGGFSGGSMERPGLQRLLRDVEAGRIDVVVVYKVDRLSRALGDFARIVEIFERHNVSFVSVTQAFNTTSSMGRLTLNILLSFAQFEREVIGERIRDKFAASRRKGMWMGGIPPLGYDVRERRLVVNENEAALVRLIFCRFLQLGSATELARELRRAGHTTKSWINQDGKHRAGKPIDKGAIYKILHNPHLPRRGGAQGGQPSRRARGDRRSRHLGQGARHSRCQHAATRQHQPDADAGAAQGPDLRAWRPCDNAVAHTQGRQALSLLCGDGCDSEWAWRLPGAQRAGGRDRGCGRCPGAASAADTGDRRPDLGGGETGGQGSSARA
jgi:DNA invertase Pin-like site-specific DNA recombinase